jgi:hypothetical protein
VDDCQVVAACLNHELAVEDSTGGVRNGLLTRAFVTLMGQVDNSEVRSVVWARVWQKMRAIVEKANPFQHLWMSGSCACVVLAGPPVDADPGFLLTRAGANDYLIDAGTGSCWRKGCSFVRSPITFTGIASSGRTWT